MKKILTLITLLLSFTLVNAQQKIDSTGGIAPTGKYRSTTMKYIAGMAISKATIAERDSIPLNLRDTGMLVLIREDSSIYTLIGGIDNINWTKVSISGSQPTTPDLNSVVHVGNETNIPIRIRGDGYNNFSVEDTISKKSATLGISPDGKPELLLGDSDFTAHLNADAISSDVHISLPDSNGVIAIAGRLNGITYPTDSHGVINFGDLSLGSDTTSVLDSVNITVFVDSTVANAPTIHAIGQKVLISHTPNPADTAFGSRADFVAAWDNVNSVWIYTDPTTLDNGAYLSDANENDPHTSQWNGTTWIRRITYHPQGGLKIKQPAVFGTKDNYADIFKVNNHEVARFTKDSSLQMPKFAGLTNVYSTWDSNGKVIAHPFDPLNVKSPLEFLDDTLTCEGCGVGGGSTVTFSTVDSMILYSGDATVAYVTDSLRGGWFNKKPVSVSLVANGGTIFPFDVDGPFVWVRDVSQAAGAKPEWFGAIPNDTINDQSAFEAIYHLNKAIQLSDNSTYYLNKFDSTAKDGITILGGRNSTIATTNTGTLMHTTKNTFLKDVNFTGGRFWFRNDNDSIYNFKMVNCTFKKVDRILYVAAINTTTVFDVFVDGCRWDSCEYGIFMATIGTIHNIKITNSVFTNLKLSGVYISNNTDVAPGSYSDISITNCHFKNIGPYTGTVASETHAAILSGENLVISNNTVQNIFDSTTNHESEAFYTKGINVSITGNTIIDGGLGAAAITAKGKPIEDYESASAINNTVNNVISNNTIIYSRDFVLNHANDGIGGIYTHSLNTTISGNVILGYVNTGIHSGFTNTTISNNQVTMNDSVKAGGFSGIVVISEGDTTKNLNITGNILSADIHDSTLYGTGIRITNFTNNANDTTVSFYISNVKIHDNHVTDYQHGVLADLYKTGVGQKAEALGYEIYNNTIKASVGRRMGNALQFYNNEGNRGSIVGEFRDFTIRNNNIMRVDTAMFFTGNGQFANFRYYGNIFDSITTKYVGFEKLTNNGVPLQDSLKIGSGIPLLGWDASDGQMKIINVLNSTNFIDYGQNTYTDSIFWTGSADPGGVTTHTWQATRIGSIVYLRVNLRYASAGTANTLVKCVLPASLPQPIAPTGFTLADQPLLYGSGGISSGIVGFVANNNKVALFANSTNTGYLLEASSASINAQTVFITIAYWTSAP